MNDDVAGPLPKSEATPWHPFKYTARQMRAYAAQAVAAERERCARLVEAMDTTGHDGYIETTGDLCEALAACIRRGTEHLPDAGNSPTPPL